MIQAMSLGTAVPTSGSTSGSTRRSTNSHARVALSALVALTAMAVAFGPTETAEAAESKPTVAGVVNVNTASRQELQLLPGVGEIRAVAIVAKRKERGGFKQVDELLEVSGIGDAMLERMRPYVTLTGKTTAERL